MDTDTLVDEMLVDGEKLLELLAENEIDVTAACWVKTSEAGAWVFYIATEEVDKKKLSEAYGNVFRLLRAIPNSLISTLDITLVGKNSPVAKDLLAIHNLYPGKPAFRSRSLKLSSVGTEEIYLYPSRKHQPIPLRQSITVSYYRQGDTNNWSASTKLGERYRGMRAKGAVSYSTGRWEGEQEGDEKHATVRVLLEVAPDLESRVGFMHPGLDRVWADQAGEMADEMFKARHPHAEIVHDNDLEEE